MFIAKYLFQSHAATKVETVFKLFVIFILAGLIPYWLSSAISNQPWRILAVFFEKVTPKKKISKKHLLKEHFVATDRVF